MTQTTTVNRHPAFLDELAFDAVMNASFLRKPIKGEVAITAVVEAVASLYATLTPVLKGSVGGRDFIEYNAELSSGLGLHAVVALTRNSEGKVSEASVLMSPLDAVLVISSKVSESLSSGMTTDFFF